MTKLQIASYLDRYIKGVNYVRNIRKYKKEDLEEVMRELDASMYYADCNY